MWTAVHCGPSPPGAEPSTLASAGTYDEGPAHHGRALVGTCACYGRVTATMGIIETLAYFTTSPLCGAWMTWPLPTYSATWWIGDP